MRCESRSVSLTRSQALRAYILPLFVLAALCAARLAAGVPAVKPLTSSTENKRAEEFSRLAAQLGIGADFQLVGPSPVWAIPHNENVNQGPQLGNAPNAKVVYYKRPFGYRGSIYADTNVPTPQANSNVTKLELPGGPWLPSGFYYLWNP